VKRHRVHPPPLARLDQRPPHMPGEHPPGFYEKYPEVTWDLAAERWRAAGRSHLLAVSCKSCGWSHVEIVLAVPERQRVAEFILECQHWYECPGIPQITTFWLQCGYVRSR
jgi:hypothetical protein